MSFQIALWMSQIILWISLGALALALRLHAAARRPEALVSVGFLTAWPDGDMRPRRNAMGAPLRPIVNSRCRRFPNRPRAGP